MNRLIRALEKDICGLDGVDRKALDRSLRLKLALEEFKSDGKIDAFAVRCWPEAFTEYGGAFCGPVAMMGEQYTPCACEADVNGAISSLILQRTAKRPAFLVDIVDMDAEDDTGVVWHCGQAPISMRDPEYFARAAIHSNRRLPLLFEFPLKPGRVTMLRLSRARGQLKFVLAGGEMLKRDLAFSGTAGVVRFDRPVNEMLDRILASGLEHHVSIAYGECRPLLRGVAAELNLPVLEL